MKLTINEAGKPFWIDVKLEDEFSESLFHEVDMSNPWLDEIGKEPDHQLAFHSNLGSITILDRMTGFGHRDTETGYRDTDGKFWLASGQFNMLEQEVATVGEAITLIKENSNNCIGE